jgi:hypothetical protein
MGFYTKDKLGKVFSFEIQKKVTLDDDTFWIMIGDDNTKILFNEKWYKNYGFEEGLTIKCLFDRINCDGELFFEPIHPKYRIGEVYTLKKYAIVEDFSDKHFENQQYKIVDGDGFQGKLLYAKAIKRNKALEVQLVKIKKGILMFIPSSFNFPIFKINEYYQFTPINSTYDERLGKCYVLKDEFGNLHLLTKEYYKNYPIRYNKPLILKVVKFSSKGFYYLEPVHPKYIEGNSYSFEIIETIFDKQKLWAIVEDCFGNLIKVMVPNEIASGSEIICSIDKLKKGKPILTFCKM